MASFTTNENQAIQFYSMREQLRLPDPAGGVFDTEDEMAIIVGLFPLEGWPGAAAPGNQGPHIVLAGMPVGRFYTRIVRMQ